MTKFTEIENLQIREAKIKYIADVWEGWGDIRNQTLNRITNYLFVLNTGGLLAALTYVASKVVTDGIQKSICLFSLGIIFSISHATLDYYSSEKCFKDYKGDVDKFYEDRLEWEELVNRNKNRPRIDWLLHIFGWLGGLAFLSGLFIGIKQITT